MKMVLITYATSKDSGEPTWIRRASCQSLRCSHTQYRRVEEASDKELEIWLHWIAAHGRLKDFKPHNANVLFLMRWLNCILIENTKSP